MKNKTFEWYRKNPENSHTLAVIAGNLMSVDSDAAKKIAEEILRTILKNDPRYPEALYSLAILLGMEGRTEEAADIYRKLLEIEPDNLIAINNLAWILCEDMGQPQQALDLAQRGLKVAPEYVDLIDTRGMAYFRLGQFQKAVQDFAKCVELYPDSTRQDITSRYHLAKVYAGLRENKKAIEYLKQVIDSGDKTGGLTSVELNDAKNLLKQLQEGI